MLSDDIKKDIEEISTSNDDADKQTASYIKACILPEIQSLEKELEAEKENNRKLRIIEKNQLLNKGRCNKVILQHEKDKQELAEALKGLIVDIECYNMLSCKKEKLLIEKHYNKKWEEIK